jgi:transposase
MRYELTDHEWTAIKPFLPNKPRGVPRVNDRRVPTGGRLGRDHERVGRHA